MLVELSIPWVIGLNVLAWLVIQWGLAWALTQWPATRFDPDNFFARSRRWEQDGRFYERVAAIKLWKDKLPDAASWFRGGFPKADLRGASPEFLERFLRETWRGELVHWIAALAWPVFCLWNPGWAVLVNAAYALAANLPCILVQRYNRARIRRLLAALSRRACAASASPPCESHRDCRDRNCHRGPPPRNKGARWLSASPAACGFPGVRTRGVNGMIKGRCPTAGWLASRLG